LDIAGGADLPFEIIDAPANRVDGEAEPFGRGLRDAAVLNGKSPESRATSRAGHGGSVAHSHPSATWSRGRPAPPVADGGKLPTMAMTA
jgi:hypothetical protein